MASALYDDDIVLWSEQQAEIIRRLGATRRDLPNELDVENVAEEIESVGRSELASVESLIQNIFVHTIKLGVDPCSEAKLHWQAEILSFHADMQRRYAPSMRQRIDVDKLWRIARKLVMLAFAQSDVAARLPEKSPFELGEILAEEIDTAALAGTVARSLQPSRVPGQDSS